MDLDPYLKMAGEGEDMPKEIPTDSDGYLTMSPYSGKDDMDEKPFKDLNDSISEVSNLIT